MDGAFRKKIHNFSTKTDFQDILSRFLATEGFYLTLNLALIFALGVESWADPEFGKAVEFWSI